VHGPDAAGALEGGDALQQVVQPVTEQHDRGQDDGRPDEGLDVLEDESGDLHPVSMPGDGG
jgi:hypothetical protein